MNLQSVGAFLGIQVIVIFTLGCNGNVQVGPPNGVDAKPGGGGGGGGGADVDENCIDLVGANGNGKHNPGRNCMEGGCHDGAVTKFTIAGTLYKDKDGSAPVAGATLVFTDENNAEIKLITASNGNYYTSQNITFPVKVKATGCPNSKSMGAEISEANGGCNKDGCHVAGKRVYLP